MPPYELDPATKERIYAEEIYRAEVRKELQAREPKKTFGARLWAWINSGFVLFVLGSVVLSSISFLYQSREHELAVAKERAQFMTRAATEVEHRSWLADDSLPESDKIAADTKFVADQYLTLAPSTTFASLYPEFAQRSAQSLLKELESACATAASCPNVEDALNQVDEVNIAARDWPSMSVADRVKERLQAAEAIQSLRNALHISVRDKDAVAKNEHKRK